MPLRVTMICLGCSSTGSDRIKAATSSAVFHLASCTGVQQFIALLMWLLSQISFADSLLWAIAEAQIEAPYTESLE